jgi:hypothetical protein
MRQVFREDPNPSPKGSGSRVASINSSVHTAMGLMPQLKHTELELVVYLGFDRLSPTQHARQSVAWHTIASTCFLRNQWLTCPALESCQNKRSTQTVKHPTGPRFRHSMKVFWHRVASAARGSTGRG